MLNVSARTCAMKVVHAIPSFTASATFRFGFEPRRKRNTSFVASCMFGYAHETSEGHTNLEDALRNTRCNHVERGRNNKKARPLPPLPLTDRTAPFPPPVRPSAVTLLG